MQQNILDRAISWVAPAAGVARLRKRAAIELMTRGYDGADHSRLKHSWNAQSTSADTEIGAAGRLLRDRMRDLVRNNSHAANALGVLVTHAVGDGIVPRTKNVKVNKLFDEWSKRCDADENLDFFGIQSLAVREMFESGDGIIRRRHRKMSDGLPLPMQLQVLECDHLDTSRESAMSGRRIIQGIEFDAINRRQAYWMFPTHPGSRSYDPASTWVSSAVPASEVIHFFEKQRTQVRGAPWGAPAISDLHELAAYDRAERERKRLEACLVGVMTGGEDGDMAGVPLKTADGDILPPGIYDQRGLAVERFAPGMFYNAVGGRDIKFSQPAATGSYDAYKTASLHTIAAGFRVPHALLSGRLDKVNYSSSKIGIEGFKKTISALQWQVIIPMLCEPLWQWFLEAAFQAGKISHMNHPAVWSPPRFYSADPGRDVAAKLVEVRSGFRSWSSVVAESGENPDDVMAAIAADNAKFDKLGLIFDSDPRHMSQAGQTQQEPAGDDDPPDKEQDE